MSTTAGRPFRSPRSLRRWWHHLEADARRQVVDWTSSATIVLFGVGSLVLCLVALRSL